MARSGGRELVTGTHARREACACRARRTPRPELPLAALDPASLARLRFPARQLRKKKNKRETHSRAHHLPVAVKAGLADLCFLPAVDARVPRPPRRPRERDGELLDMRQLD